MINATSIVKVNALQHLIADIYSHDYDIVMITETWLTSKQASNLFSIPGFEQYRRDRQDGRNGGGLCVYVRNNIKCTVINVNDIIVDYDKRIEIMCLSCQCNSVSYIVCLCYHPPSPLYHPRDFTQHLSTVIDYVTTNFHSDFIVICGDMNNLDTLFLGTNYGFSQIVEAPTHGNRIIDMFFINRPDLYRIIVSISVIKTKHKAVIAMPDDDDSTDLTVFNDKKIKHIVYDTRQQHLDRLRHILGTYDWSPLYNCSSIDDLYNAFLFIILNCIDMCIPRKTVTLRANEPFYITPLVKSLLVKRNRLRRKGRMADAAIVADKINHLITEVQHKQYENLSLTCPKKLWQAVRDHNNVTINCINNPVLAQPNLLNNFFANISTDTAYNSSDIDSLRMPSDEKVCETQFSEIFIERQLRLLKKTSPGYDGIPAWLLKGCSYELAHIVSYILNFSLNNGCLPSSWLTAIVTPVPKVSVPRNIDEFRPISVTPILSRLCERLLVKQYLYPSIPRGLISDQFAYKPTGSTSCALVKMFDFVTASIDANPGKPVRGLLVDFSKAFDTVNHLIILKKLKTLNLPPNIFNWIISFLSNRCQITKINGVTSNKAIINRGIVQGSVLGPYLFLIMISDLKPLHKTSCLIKYADDLTLLTDGGETDSVFLDEFYHILNWARDNNLTINFIKTKEMAFSLRKHKSDVQKAITKVQLINETKLLGIVIDDRLKLDKHVRNTLTICNQRLYLLKLLRNKGLSLKCLSNIFHSLVVNRITYCLPAWGGFIRLSDVSLLNTLFRKAKRWGLTDTIYNLEGLRTYNDQVLFDKICLPNHCLNQILPPTRQNNINVRYNEQFKIPKFRTNTYKNSFVVRSLLAL